MFQLTVVSMYVVQIGNALLAEMSDGTLREYKLFGYIPDIVLSLYFRNKTEGKLVEMVRECNRINKLQDSRMKTEEFLRIARTGF